MVSSWIAAAASAAGICLFALALLRLPRLRRLAPLLLLAFTTVDLGTRVTALAPRERAELFTAPSPARAVPAGERLWQEADWLDESELARAYQRLIPRSHAVWQRRNSLAFTMPPAWGIPTILGIDVDETTLRPTEELLDTFWEARRRGLPGWPEPFLSMSGAGRRTVYRSPERAWVESEGRIESLIPISVVATEAAPRYAFATEIVETRSREELLEKLDGKNGRGTAYLDMQPFELGKGEVLAVRELSDAIEIDVGVSGAPALLTLAVTPHRYWRATVDGDPATLHRSNIGYQAVLVPPEARTVRLVYRNPIVRPAAGVSLLAILMSLVLLVRGRARP
jgi:hypothetical protein